MSTPNINLMPRIEKQKSNFQFFYIVISILMLVAITVMTWLFFTAREDLNQLQVQGQALQTELTAAQVELAAKQSTTASTITESLAFVERVSYAVSPLIDEINGLLPKYTYLINYAFTETGVQINVDFESLAVVSQYVERLNNSPYFDNVQLNSLNGFEINSGTDLAADTSAIDFSESVRYSATIAVVIDSLYLATGGGN